MLFDTKDVPVVDLIAGPQKEVLLHVLRRDLGDDGWRWVSRQSNMLVAPVSSLPSTADTAAAR